MQTLAGDDAVSTVEKYNADIAFFSCRGLSLDGRATDFSVEENILRQKMMKQAKVKVLLCAEKKIGKAYIHNLCRLQDIDYIVSYVDPDDDTLKKVNLNSEFKTCYENYTDAEGNHMITQDCAQEIIANVIKPRGSSREDITYDVYYIIRDKAGNASAVIAKGILYATIYPSTNVIIQNVAASLTNSEIVAVNLGIILTL